MRTFLPRRWRQRPTGRVEINWNHPLTQGLSFCANVKDSIDLVGNSDLTRIGTIQREFVQNGAPSSGLGFGAKYGVGTTDALSGVTIADQTGDLTVACTCMRFAADLGSGFGRILDISTAAGTDLRIYDQGTGLPEIDRPFTGTENSFGSSASPFSSEGVYDNLLFSLRADGNNGAQQMYINGVAVGTSGGNATGTPSTFNGVPYIGNRAAADRNWGGVIESVLMWNWQFDQGAATAYNENRFQIYKPYLRKFYLTPPPGGAADSNMYLDPLVFGGGL